MVAAAADNDDDDNSDADEVCDDCPVALFCTGFALGLTVRLGRAKPRLTEPPLKFPCRRFSKSFFAEFKVVEENPEFELNWPEDDDSKVLVLFVSVAGAGPRLTGLIFRVDARRFVPRNPLMAVGVPGWLHAAASLGVKLVRGLP